MKKRAETRPIRIAILEKDPQVRENLAALIFAGTDDLIRVGSYASVTQAIRRIPMDLPECLILDLHPSRSTRKDPIQWIHAQFPELQIIVLTDFEESEAVLSAFRSGASAYLLKSPSSLEMGSAIRKAFQGEVPMTGLIARKLIEAIQKTQDPRADPFSRLTLREKEVLGHLSNGLAYKKISDLLGLSMDTVRTHIRRMYKKLAVHTRTEAVVQWLRHADNP